MIQLDPPVAVAWHADTRSDASVISGEDVGAYVGGDDRAAGGLHAGVAAQGHHIHRRSWPQPSHL